MKNELRRGCLLIVLGVLFAVHLSRGGAAEALLIVIAPVLLCRLAGCRSRQDMLFLGIFLAASIPFRQESVNLYSFGQYSLLDKLNLGLTGTTARLIFLPNALLISGWALVVLVVIARRRGTMAYLITAVPALFLLRVLFAEATSELNGLAASNAPFLWYQDSGLILGPEVAYYYFPYTLPMLFQLICILGLMAAGVYMAIGSRKEAVYALLALLISFLLRILLAFHSDLAQIGEIAMMPVYYAVIFSLLLCVRDCNTDGSRKWPVRVIYSTCAVSGVVNLLGMASFAW